MSTEANQNNFSESLLQRCEVVEECSFPRAYYDQDGDCIELLFRNESYYARRVDELITVYCERGSNEPVGALIKGVRAFIDEFLQASPGFRAEYNNRDLSVEYLLTAGMWQKTEEDESISLYLELRNLADKANLRIQLCTA